MTGELLRVEGLTKHFRTAGATPWGGHGPPVRALDGVDLTVAAGETLGIVGESGCGKSTLGRCVTRLLDPTAGRVVFQGRDITHLSRAELRPVRRDLMMVFQDPFGSLNPRKPVGSAIAEPLEVHGIGTAREHETRVHQLLDLVGLRSAHAGRYPHELSGGQRQRVGIARALALNPKLVVCDEPVSALDVSVQAQILNLLQDLQDTLNLTYIFIAHDLGVVRHISDRVVVMYLGKVVESAPRDALYEQPRHPYAGALLDAVPVPDPADRERQRLVLEGDIPSAVAPPRGCSFHPRCPRAQPGTCDHDAPHLASQLDAEHLAACHFPLERTEAHA